MRTTLSLDDDVAVLLEQMRKARDTTFKRVVNDALREGLARLSSPAEPGHFVPSRSIWGAAIIPTWTMSGKFWMRRNGAEPADDSGRREPAGLCLGPQIPLARNSRSVAGWEAERIRPRGASLGVPARLYAGGHQSPHLRETCAGKRGVGAGGALAERPQCMGTGAGQSPPGDPGTPFDSGSAVVRN
jgi:hypothetical protein